MNFPRYVFAIGGAGKNLLFTTLEKDWIIKEILKPQFAPTEVDITIVDTAIVEENNDRERIDSIEKNIEKIAEGYRADITNVDKNIGRINLEYKLLTKEMSLQSPYALIGIEEKVKKATGATTWWINDPQLGEEWSKRLVTKENFQELNFSKGVYRKRAIGKAIYYKAISEGLFEVNINRSAQIDIIIGLGGGTGSGIAIDLAKRLKTIQPTADITLFGVLSTRLESPDEKANNFAMLGEIENTVLSGESPFKEIILIPMEITEFPGREKADDAAERLLREFDETFPHILIAYHNNQAERLFTGSPDFAPFIIATSQFVRFNVESTKRLKDRLIDALNNKATSMKNEGDMYAIISKFIDEFYPEESQRGLPEEDKSLIKERLSKFNIVLSHELFQEFNYNGISLLKKAIEDGIKGSGSEDIEKQVMSIKSEVDMISVGNEGFKEETDKMLYAVLKNDIDAIESMRNILNKINDNVQNDLTRETLKIIVAVDEDRARNKLNKIREESGKLILRKRQFEADIKSLGENIASCQEKMSGDISKGDTEWKQVEVKNIESINSIDDATYMLKNSVTGIKNELEEYVRRIGTATNTKAIDVEPTKSIEELADRLGQGLEKIGIYYDDKSTIVRNLNNLKEFRKAQIESGKSIPFFDKLLKTGRAGRTKEFRNRAILKAAEMNNDRIFEVGSSSSSNSNSTVNSIYNYDIESIVDKKKDDIISGIGSRVMNKYPNATPGLFVVLKDVLRTPERHKDANIKDIIMSNLGCEIDIDKTNNSLKEKITEVSRISKDMDAFKTLETLITKNIKDVLGSLARHLKSYHDEIGNIGKDVKVIHSAKRSTVRYIMDIQPKNIYRATVTGANINNILEEKGEELILRQNIRDAIDRTVDTGYNVMVRRIIENNDHTKRWERSKVMNAFVTIANIDPASIDARDIIVHAFDIERENLSEWKCPWGDAWGVGIVLFVTGVPLDNINNVVDPRSGYYRYYESEGHKDAIFLHHSHLLEEGRFVKRKSIFNIEKSTDRDLLLQDNNSVKKLFSENYEEKLLKDVYGTNESNIR